MDWEGRAVLITGGSRGIGLATASRFLGAGASVTIAGRSEDALAAARAELSCPDRLRTVAADVSTVPGCRAAATAALDAFGRLDVLFTNAGSYEAAPVAEVTEDMWDRTIDTHLKGTFFSVQASESALARNPRLRRDQWRRDAGLLGFRGGLGRPTARRWAAWST